MSLPLERLEAEALELSMEDRARLATRLLESLESEGEEDSEDVERAWIAEAERRYERHRARDDDALPADEVLARVRERLSQR